MCIIDVSNVFDKMNHNGLLIKLMKRHVPEKSVTIVRKLACHWYDVCKDDVCKVAQCVVPVVSLKLWYSAGWGAVSLLICHIHR